MSFVSFAEVKERVSIGQVVQQLGIPLTKQGRQLRGACPACKSGGPRALTVNEEKGAYYCFAQGRGGDQIALAAHILGIPVKEAALRLAGNGTSTVPREQSLKGELPRNSSQPPSPPARKGFDAEAYAARLDPEHDALAVLNLSATTLRDFKAGYTGSGVLRGRLALPVHDRQGNVLGYVGQALGEQQPAILVPNGVDVGLAIFGAHRVTEGPLALVRDPLAVLSACENGIENAVAFLTEGISAEQLIALSSLMDDRHNEYVELY